MFTGNTFSLSQVLNISSDLPFGMDQDYLAAVKPAAILRTWASALTSLTVNHSLGLKIQFGMADTGFDATRDQIHSTTFSNQAPTDSDDFELSFVVQNFFGFDSIQ